MKRDNYILFKYLTYFCFSFASLHEESGFAEIAEKNVSDHVKNALPCGKAGMKNRCINKEILT